MGDKGRGREVCIQSDAPTYSCEIGMNVKKYVFDPAIVDMIRPNTLISGEASK